MGSSFGKVRKYNLNSVDSTLKYNMVSDEEMKHSSTSPVPADNNEIFSHSERPSLRNRVERSNQKLAVSQEAGGSFGTGFQPPIIPEYYNLRAKEEILLPQQAIKGSNVVIDDGDYITLNESIAAAPNPPPRPPKYEAEPPPLPPRNKVFFNRPDTSPIRQDLGMNSNPKPNQKVYSAQDLNKLLKPLNKQNSFRGKLVNRLHSSQLHHHHYPKIPDRHPEVYVRPGGYYSGTLVCDCQRYKSIRAYHNEYHSPPPYNHMGFIQDTGQPIHHSPQVYYPPPKYYYDEPNPPQYHSVSRDHPNLNTTHQKYNTISLDRDIQTHNWIGYRPPTLCNHHTEPLKGRVVQEPQNGVNHQNSNKNGSHKEDKMQNSSRERTSLHHSDIVSQPEYMNDVPTYRSLRTPSCYTIPEEGSWLPQFQYNPALHHLHHRGYHH